MSEASGGSPRPKSGRAADIVRVFGPSSRPSAHPPAAVPLEQSAAALAPRQRWALLAVILLVAAALRLNHVTQPLDDTFSWRQASTAMMADNFYRTSWNIFYPEVSWTGPGPNYQGREFQTFSYLTALLYALFGQHESLGRALAATFGTWGVFAMYALVRRVWDTRRALAAAGMLAIVPGAIFIDRSFLPDPAMLSLTITAMWLVVRALQTGKRGHLVLACAVSSLAFLTKLPGIVALGPMIYAAVVTLRQLPRPERRRRGAWLALALILTLLPVAGYYTWAVHLGQTYPPYHIAGAANWVWKKGELLKWLGNKYYLDSFFQNLVGWLWTAPVVGLVLVGCVVAPPATREPAGAKQPDPIDDAAEPARPPLALRCFFHWWMFGCVVLYLLGARELSENVWNLHVFNVFAAAMAGHALVLIWEIPRFRRPREPSRPRHAHPLMTPFRIVPPRAWRVAFLAAVIVAFGQYRLKDFYKEKARNGYLLGKALAKVSQPGDLIVTMADDVGDPIPIYYAHRRGWVFPQPQTTYDTPDPWKPWNMIPQDPKRSIRMFEDLRAKGAKWLGITAKPMDDTPGKQSFWEHHPEVVRHIGRTCRFVEKTKFGVIYQIYTPAELAAKEAADAAKRKSTKAPATVPVPTTTPTAP